MSGIYSDGLGFSGRLELLKYRTAGLVGNSRGLYKSVLAVRRKNRSTFVTPTTDLCIDAPMGCGNSFIVKAVSLANPGIAIAHHHHVVAQLDESARLSIPAVTILRDPGDAALSRAVSWGNASVVGASLYMWKRFWEGWQRLDPATPVISFETLKLDPSAVVRLINERYGTSFFDTLPSDAEVFQAMDRYRAGVRGPESLDQPRPTRPDASKTTIQNVLRPEVESHPSLSAVRSLHRMLLENAL